MLFVKVLFILLVSPLILTGYIIGMGFLSIRGGFNTAIDHMNSIADWLQRK